MSYLLEEWLRPEYLLLYLFAYGWSFIPTAYLVARFIDRLKVKEQGVKGYNRSYLYRNVSKSAALLVFLADMQKGLLPCAIGLSLAMPVKVLALAGVFSVLGHCFSLWGRFFKPHAHATALGAMIIIYWPAALIMATANFCLLALYVNRGLASIIAIFLCALIVWIGLANKVVLLMVLAMAVIDIARYSTSNT